MSLTSLELTRSECLQLLAAVPIGRVVFTQRALPAIRPVNFRVDGGRVLIRCRWGAVMSAAAEGSLVAFEVDDYDVKSRVGWSVTVLGHAAIVPEGVGRHRLDDSDLVPWAGGARDAWVSIDIDLVEGRRVGESHPLPLGAAHV